MIPANLRIRVEDSSEVGNDIKLRNQSIALRAPPSSPAANISNVGISSLPVARIRPHNGNLERLGNWKLDVKKLKQDELSPAHVTTASTTTESILSSGKSRGSTKHKTQRRSSGSTSTPPSGLQQFGYGVLSPSGGAWNQTAGWASPRIVDNPVSKKNPSPASSPTERRLRPSSSSKIRMIIQPSPHAKSRTPRRLDTLKDSAKRHQKDMWTVSRTTLGNNGRTSSDKKMAKKQRNVKLRQPETGVGRLYSVSHMERATERPRGKVERVSPSNNSEISTQLALLSVDDDKTPKPFQVSASQNPLLPSYHLKTDSSMEAAVSPSSMACSPSAMSFRSSEKSASLKSCLKKKTTGRGGHNLGPLILPTTSLFNTQHHVKEEQRNTSDSEQIEEDDIDLEVSSVMSVWASPRFHQSSTPTGRGSKKGKSPRGWIQHKKSPRELLLKKSPRELLREVQQGEGRLLKALKSHTSKGLEQKMQTKVQNF
mmetsp:Transcript_18437/g.29984  ORF Transcript_18437/g.29984 Transcript_18437/m.29984 type:complete len:483 (+) Transcript_18437:141-1589(+)